MSLRPKFGKTVFHNGLTLLTERHPEYRSISMGAWVKVGTRHERPRESGVSHFLEHMLFKGTEGRSALDIAREVDHVGGDFNAFTAREYTCFHLLLLSRDTDLGLKILGDVILNSNFESEELERERKVILQEIAMVEEAPEELVHDIFFELAYSSGGSHGLGRPILGSESSIRRLKRREILGFFRKHYRPDQLIISIAGNISHDKIVRKLRPLIAHPRWPGRPEGPVSPKSMGYEKAPKVREGCWWVVRPTEQVHVVWAVQGTTYDHADRFPAFLLNAYLGGGMSSQLYQEIREKKGLAYSVYSSLSAFKDSGVFSVYAATSMNQVGTCLRLIEESAYRLQRELLPANELKVIQDYLKGTILLSSDSVENRMESIAKNEIFMGKYVSVDEVCKMIDAVTPQDLRRVARKFFKPDRRSLLFLGPKPSPKVRKMLKPIFPKKYQR
jgi:predicted Zn-dependent peptidase